MTIRTVLLVFTLALPSFANSIALPTGGFAWVVPDATTVGNVQGDYSLGMPVIYALQFSQSGAFNFMFYKAGDKAYAGTFTRWLFKKGVFSASVTGTMITYIPGTWQIKALSPFTGSINEHLNLIPGCQGYACGSLGTGRLSIDNKQVVPEPASLVLMGTGLLLIGLKGVRYAGMGTPKI